MVRLRSGRARREVLAMTEKMDKTERTASSKERPARNADYERIADDLEKWANSSGLQKPK